MEHVGRYNLEFEAWSRTSASPLEKSHVGCFILFAFRIAGAWEKRIILSSLHEKTASLDMNFFECESKHVRVAPAVSSF
jgi:hypothetical protein